MNAVRPSTDAEKAEILREAADWYIHVCDLWDDVDGNDDIAVLRLAFTESDCDDFSWILNAMTGWQVVTAVWTTRDGDLGHHSLVRSPDGRLLDACGWCGPTDLAVRYTGRRNGRIRFSDVEAVPSMEPQDWDDEGMSATVSRLVGVVRSLPGEPFATEEFGTASSLPVVGADIPRSARAHAEIGRSGTNP